MCFKRDWLCWGKLCDAPPSERRFGNTAVALWVDPWEGELGLGGPPQDPAPHSLGASNGRATCPAHPTRAAQWTVGTSFFFPTVYSTTTINYLVALKQMAHTLSALWASLTVGLLCFKSFFTLSKPKLSSDTRPANLWTGSLLSMSWSTIKATKAYVRNETSCHWCYVEFPITLSSALWSESWTSCKCLQISAGVSL